MSQSSFPMPDRPAGPSRLAAAVVVALMGAAGLGGAMLYRQWEVAQAERAAAAAEKLAEKRDGDAIDYILASSNLRMYEARARLWGAVGRGAQWEKWAEEKRAARKEIVDRILAIWKENPDDLAKDYARRHQNEVADIEHKEEGDIARVASEVKVAAGLSAP